MDDHHLQQAGKLILYAYSELLLMLKGDCDGDQCLQNGLVAAVAGLSQHKFSNLSEDLQASHRD